MSNQCPWPIAFFAYFLAFFIPGCLIQVMAIRGWRRKHLLLLIVPCLIGAVLVLVWDYAIKPTLR
jgi:hypothetical protein